MSPPDVVPGTELFLTLRFTLADDTPWAKAGHEVAAAQFPMTFPAPASSTLRQAQRPLIERAKLPVLTLEQTDSEATIRGDDFQITYDKINGQISSWRYNDVELIAAGPLLNVWRAPTDNDGIKLDDERDQLLDEWLKAGLHELRHEVEELAMEQPAPQKIIIRTRARAVSERAPAALEYEQTLTIFGDGQVLLDNHIVAHHGLPPLPRIGLTLSLPAGFEHLTWFGRGPFENYRDRNSGALVGKYRSTVSEQYVPYILPQEHGNKTDVRWVALANDAGAGLLATGIPAMEMSAGHYTAHDLFAAAHTHELTPRAETFLNLDLQQMGLGSASCGPATLPPYIIAPGAYSFSVRLRPFTRDDPSPAQLARTALPKEL